MLPLPTLKTRSLLNTGALLSLLFGLSLLSHPAQAQGYDCSTQTQLPQAQCQALVALYNATGGASWTTNTGWLQTSSPCSWHGIICSPSGVLALTLGANNLNGSLPTEIGNLTGLATLFLDGNNLSGSIPASFGNLTSLATLFLDGNNLSGPIPPEMGNLTSLSFLQLGGNQLQGPLPDLSNLTNLTKLLLGSNQLSGSLPTWLNDLTGLTQLYLDSNQFTGSIPDLSGLTDLQHLWLYNNDLDGSIPASLGSLTNLNQLIVGGNGLTGPVPEELGDLTNLTRLILDINQLSGTVPLPVAQVGAPLGGECNFTNNGPGLCFPNTPAYQALADGNNQICGVTLDPNCAPAANAAVQASAEATTDDAVSVSGIQVQDAPVPEQFALSGNYPNPFNPSTTVRFDLPADAEVEVSVFDVLGRLVLVKEAGRLAAGANREVTLDLSRLTSGVYLYRVMAQTADDAFVGLGRMTLVK